MDKKEKRVLSTEEKFYYNQRIVEYKTLTKEDKRKSRNIFKHIVEKIHENDTSDVKKVKIDLDEDDMIMLKDYIKITIDVEDYTPSNNAIREAYESAKVKRQVDSDKRYVRVHGDAFIQNHFRTSLQSSYINSTNLPEYRRRKALAKQRD